MRRQTVAATTCPSCGAAPFDQFLPGLVARWGRVWWAPWRRRAPYAVICRACKEVVGWEWDGRRERGEEEIMPEESKRLIEVQRGETWERTTMAELRVGDRFRMWDNADKTGYLGCFRADGVPTLSTDCIWRIVANFEGKEA